MDACVLANSLNENLSSKLSKIILLSPALNQKDLMRYWFVTWQVKKHDPSIIVTWDNYKKYLDESAFIIDSKRTDKVSKKSHIKSQYFIQAQDNDWSNTFDNMEDNILHIHWSNDLAVPIQSINTSFSNTLIVQWWDHDMESPNQFDQWIDKAVDFIKS